MRVGTSETKSQREKLHCTFIHRSLGPEGRVQGSLGSTEELLIPFSRRQKEGQDKTTAPREGDFLRDYPATHFKEEQSAAGARKGFLALLDIKPEDSR